MTFKSECEEVTRNRLIVLRENRSEIRFTNQGQQKVRIVTVDGCEITDGLKCDFLVISICGKEHFVELKGNNVHHAIEQLKATIPRLSQNAKQSDKICFIISSRCPLLTADIQRIKKQFKKNFNSKLVVKNRKCCHGI